MPKAYFSFSINWKSLWNTLLCKKITLTQVNRNILLNDRWNPVRVINLWSYNIIYSSWKSWVIYFKIKCKVYLKWWNPKAAYVLMRNKCGSLEGAHSLSELVFNLASLSFSYLHNENMVTNEIFMEVLLTQKYKMSKDR